MLSMMENLLFVSVAIVGSVSATMLWMLLRRNYFQKTSDDGKNDGGKQATEGTSLIARVCKSEGKRVVGHDSIDVSDTKENWEREDSSEVPPRSHSKADDINNQTSGPWTTEVMQTACKYAQVRRMEDNENQDSGSTETAASDDELPASGAHKNTNDNPTVQDFNENGSHSSEQAAQTQVVDLHWNYLDSCCYKDEWAPLLEDDDAPDAVIDTTLLPAVQRTTPSPVPASRVTLAYIPSTSSCSQEDAAVCDEENSTEDEESTSTSNRRVNQSITSAWSSAALEPSSFVSKDASFVSLSDAYEKYEKTGTATVDQQGERDWNRLINVRPVPRNTPRRPLAGSGEQLMETMRVLEKVRFQLIAHNHHEKDNDESRSTHSRTATASPVSYISPLSGLSSCALSPWLRDADEESCPRSPPTLQSEESRSTSASAADSSYRVAASTRSSLGYYYSPEQLLGPDASLVNLSDALHAKQEATDSHSASSFGSFRTAV